MDLEKWKSNFYQRFIPIHPNLQSEIEKISENEDKFIFQTVNNHFFGEKVLIKKLEALTKGFEFDLKCQVKHPSMLSSYLNLSFFATKDYEVRFISVAAKEYLSLTAFLKPETENISIDFSVLSTSLQEEVAIIANFLKDYYLSINKEKLRFLSGMYELDIDHRLIDLISKAGIN